MDTASFGGAPFQQTWYDLPLWEHFLNEYPCRSIVELGTGQGGMAVFFAMQALARGMKFRTFDREPLTAMSTREVLATLGADWHLIDIFDRPEIVRAVLREFPHPIVLFCDDGNKPREFQTFAPSLVSGDLVAVHDWNAEIRAEDIRPALPMILQEECEATNSVTRFFRVP